MRLLIIGSGKTANLVRPALVSPMFELLAAEVDTALAVARGTDVDAILLEMGSVLPAAELVQWLRLAKVRAPVLLITPPDRLIEVVRALKAGADDYLTDPVDPEAVVKRLLKLVRDHSARVHPVLLLGKLKIDLERHTVEVNRTLLRLTGKEFQILELLALRQGTTVTKAQLVNHLYVGAYEPIMKIIDVFVCRLRRKLSEAG